jgi:hypothetical protein
VVGGRKHDFDVIVIGGGTFGSVIAEHLFIATQPAVGVCWCSKPVLSSFHAVTWAGAPVRDDDVIASDQTVGGRVWHGDEGETRFARFQRAGCASLL